MKTIFWTRNTRGLLQQRYAVAWVRSYCVSKSNNGDKAAVSNPRNLKSNSKGDGKSLNRYHETYQQLDNLDFSTAAQILFTETPKKKKFGFDFHLVQFFFACMPSLAVYLVAQYARYDMRKMDAELEKKKQEEEAKAKAELEAAKQREVDAQLDLKEVKVRLNKLEESVKEIAVVSRSKPSVAYPPRKEESSSKEILSETGISADKSQEEEPQPKTQNVK